MKKPFILVTAACLLAGLATAHEFWLLPTHFFVKPGETLRANVLVGEGFQGNPSEGRKNRVIQYQHLTPSGKATKLTPAMVGDNYGEVSVTANEPGTHVISFTNTAKYIQLEPAKFLAYLREDGLDNVIKAREQRGETNKPGRELYQRCARTLILAGAVPGNLSAQVTNMLLEITPAQNPYALKPGQIADFQIVFGQKPLAKALVCYWNRDGQNHLTQEKHRSDANGRVQFRLRAGSNMVSVATMIPFADPAKADWQSYWGSLTFGCR